MQDILMIIGTLSKCRLFTHFTEENLKSIINNKCTYLKKYSSNDVIFIEEEPCQYLSVIISGTVEIQKFDSNGNILIVSTLEEGNVFGENLLFGDRHFYPMSVVCKSSSFVLHISKDYVYTLCETDHIFMRQMLRILSNKAMVLSSKLKQVSMRSLRQMICHFITAKYKETGENIIDLNMSKKEWAEKLGVQRPSLSRELIKMKDDGLIDYDRKTITILDIEGIESEN
ncbi:cAMP-binding protein [Clostridium polyendosporum]|uniref:cAMP-binding protein n=1 Tax=Clostridium polyendosporum TaxID=69208 RepID=A0A919VGV3_9CLOT|nr:Crp/Fnr family transcriptional regulator [Clostridium polyendosporum]GIM29026.1 cAMP-binding protein [Clostridium polyendosporum]